MKTYKTQPSQQLITTKKPQPKNVTFKGGTSMLKNAGKDIVDFFEPERQGNMGRWLFIAAAFSFLLPGRLFSSRDKDEVRETLTRDVPTIVIAVQGVPVLEKLIAKGIQKHKGIAILTDPGTKNRGLASVRQINQWYTYNKDMDKGLGLKGFLNRLSNVGCNLKKTISALDEGIANSLKDAPENNDKFINDLFKVDKNKKLVNEELINKIKKAFVNRNNNALKKASYLKALPKLAGIGLTLGLIGLFIPKLNIFITEMINTAKAIKAKHDAADKEKEALIAKRNELSNYSFGNESKTFANFSGK